MSHVDALDAASIRQALAAQGEALAVEVLDLCESTNTELLARGGESAPLMLLAEVQSAGRGRRGRRWQSPRGAALTLSIRWLFSGDASRLRGLSLTVGVAVANALRDLGAQGVALKWPNDLMAPNAAQKNGVRGKLGGVLIETRSAAGGIAAVIGAGINCRRVPGLDARLNRPVASLEELLDPLPARNEIAARLAAELARTLRTFESAGFEAFRDQWHSMHAYRGARLRVRAADGSVIAGIAEGVAPDGALLLRNRRGLRSIASGSVVRAAP